MKEPGAAVDHAIASTAVTTDGAPHKRRLWTWSLGLMIAYVALSFLLDPRGTMGADEGAKVATLKVMAEQGSFRPDVGYWAAEWDPEGIYHGLTYTTRFGDQYVNVSTLPMIMVGKPLIDVGGYRATVLLPMLGGVLTALAARALAVRMVDRGEERSVAPTLSGSSD